MIRLLGALLAAPMLEPAPLLARRSAAHVPPRIFNGPVHAYACVEKICVPVPVLTIVPLPVNALPKNDRELAPVTLSVNVPVMLSSLELAKPEARPAIVS